VDKPKVCEHCGDRFCSKHVMPGSHECPEVQHFTIGTVAGETTAPEEDQQEVTTTSSSTTRTASRPSSTGGPSFDEQLENFERQERERATQREEHYETSSDLSIRRSVTWYALRRLVTGTAVLFLLSSVYGMVSLLGIAPAGLPSMVPVVGPLLQTSANVWLLSIPTWAAVAWFSLKL
jgi:hypothetical protein